MILISIAMMAPLAVLAVNEALTQQPHEDSGWSRTEAALAVALAFTGLFLMGVG